MRAFFKRNIPIFVIGGITLSVFILIIILAQSNPPTSPGLKEVKEEELIDTHTPTSGNENAKLVLVEFSDFQCPACKEYQATLSKFMQWYKDDLRIAFRNFPLPQHQNSNSAAIAAMVAAEEGKFWEYSEKLFENQENLGKDVYLRIAEEVGIDRDKFDTELRSQRYQELVTKDVRYGMGIGVNSTPTFYLNGKLISPRNPLLLDELITQEITKLQTETQKESIKTENKTKTPDNSIVPEVLNIEYTSDGFIPRYAQATLGQPVRWLNKSQDTIRIVQRVSFFTEMEKPVSIPPGGFFTQIMSKVGMWAYEEETSRRYGSVEIQPKSY